MAKYSSTQVPSQNQSNFDAHSCANDWPGDAGIGVDKLHDEQLMRRFIRHPSDIPIHFAVKDSATFDAKPLRDVSRGGLSFDSDIPLEVGSIIYIEIPVKQPAYTAQGRVAWCRKHLKGFAVGVEFENASTSFSVRMVEQVCYIEHYRKTVAECEGRELNSEEAAAEWVEKFAAKFPH